MKRLALLGLLLMSALVLADYSRPRFPDLEKMLAINPAEVVPKAIQLRSEAKEQGDVAKELDATILLASAYFALDDLDSTHQIVREGVTLATNQGYSASLSQLLAIQSEMLNYEGRLNRADAISADALALAKASGDLRLLAGALKARAFILTHTGAEQKALLLFSQAAQIYIDHGDSAGANMVLDEIGHINLYTKNFKAAIKFYQQAARYSDKDDVYNQGVSHLNLGWAYFEDGDFQQARAHLDKGMTIAEKINNEELRVHAKWRLARLLIVMKQNAEAMPHLEYALDYFSKRDDPYWKFLVMQKIADAWIALNDKEKARMFLEQAEAMLDQVDTASMDDEDPTRLAKSYQALGEHEKAVKFLDAALGRVRKEYESRIDKAELRLRNELSEQFARSPTEQKQKTIPLMITALTMLGFIVVFMGYLLYNCRASRPS